MPTVKSISDMVDKYTVKYSGDNFKATLAKVLDVMDARYQAGTTPIYEKVEEARALLDSLGVPTGKWGLYIAFVESAVKRMFSYNGATFEKELAGLKAYFISLGAEETVLNKLINLLIGRTPSY